MKKIMPSKSFRSVKYFDVKDLSKILDLTTGSVRDYLRKDKIESIKIGLKYYVSEKSLSNFLMCKGIRNMPDSEFITMINKAVETKFSEWTEKAIPLMQKIVTEFLIKKEKEKFKVNIKKVEEKNKELEKVLPKKIVKHLQDRTEEVKKEFEKVK